MASDFHSSIDSIQRQLRAGGIDGEAVERFGTELADIGASVTAQIESEFIIAVDPAESSAA